MNIHQSQWTYQSVLCEHLVYSSVLCRECISAQGTIIQVQVFYHRVELSCYTIIVCWTIVWNYRECWDHIVVTVNCRSVIYCVWAVEQSVVIRWYICCHGKSANRRDYCSAINVWCVSRSLRSVNRIAKMADIYQETGKHVRWIQYIWWQTKA